LNATYQGNEVQRPPLFKISIRASGSRSLYNFDMKENKSSPWWTSSAGEGSEIAHVFVMLVLICWLHWPPREGEYVCEGTQKGSK